MKRLSQFKRVLAQVLTVALLVQPMSVSAAAAEKEVVAETVSVVTASDNSVSAPSVVTAADATIKAADAKNKFSKGITVSCVNGVENVVNVTAGMKVTVLGFKASEKLPKVVSSVNGADVAKIAKSAQAKVKKENTLIAPKSNKKTGSSYTVVYADGATTLKLNVTNPAFDKNVKKIVLNTAATTPANGAVTSPANGVVTASNGVESVTLKVSDAASVLSNEGSYGLSMLVKKNVTANFNSVNWTVKKTDVKKDTKTAAVSSKVNVNVQLNNDGSLTITPDKDTKGSVKVVCTVNGKKYATTVKFSNKALSTKAAAKQAEARKAAAANATIF